MHHLNLSWKWGHNFFLRTWNSSGRHSLEWRNNIFARKWKRLLWYLNLKYFVDWGARLFIGYEFPYSMCERRGGLCPLAQVVVVEKNHLSFLLWINHRISQECLNFMDDLHILRGWNRCDGSAHFFYFICLLLNFLTCWVEVGDNAFGVTVYEFIVKFWDWMTAKALALVGTLRTH